jgi:hypothetical protein
MARRATLTRITIQNHRRPRLRHLSYPAGGEGGVFVVCGAQSNRACLNTVSMEAVQQQGQEQPETIC